MGAKSILILSLSTAMTFSVLTDGRYIVTTLKRETGDLKGAADYWNLSNKTKGWASKIG